MTAPRHDGATRATSLMTATTIAEQLTEAGSSDIRQRILELNPAPAVSILATQG